jgi:uncharacterized protein (TIGR03084 family)
MSDIVDDLEAEHGALDALVAGLTEDQWRSASAAAGWTIADSVAHLAMSDEAAIASVEGRGQAYFEAALADPAAALARQDEQAAARTGAEILAWWRENRRRLLAGLRTVAPGARLYWGVGEMSAASFTTARLMECWAHGLDCFAGLGVAPVDTDRIRHVCFLGYRTLPYAFDSAKVAMPAPLEDLQLVLTGPDGATVWQFGRTDAPQSIVGAAGEWARVATRRKPVKEARTLRADGPLAEAAIRVAKAYLL